MKDNITLCKIIEQEKQIVLNELKDWEHKERLRARKTSEEYPTENEEQRARLYALSAGRFDILENLKRKLNEMEKNK